MISEMRLGGGANLRGFWGKAVSILKRQLSTLVLTQPDLPRRCRFGGGSVGKLGGNMHA